MSYCTTRDKNGRTLYWRVTPTGKRKRVKKTNVKGKPGPCKSKKKVVTRGPEAKLEDLPPELLEEVLRGVSPRGREGIRATSKTMRSKVRASKQKYIWIVGSRKRTYESKIVAFNSRRRAREYFEKISNEKILPEDMKRLDPGLRITYYDDELGYTWFIQRVDLL